MIALSLTALALAQAAPAARPRVEFRDADGKPLPPEVQQQVRTSLTRSWKYRSAMAANWLAYRRVTVLTAYSAVARLGADLGQDLAGQGLVFQDAQVEVEDAPDLLPVAAGHGRAEGRQLGGAGADGGGPAARPRARPGTGRPRAAGG